jgi:hypothetical protein
LSTPGGALMTALGTLMAIAATVLPPDTVDARCALGVPPDTLRREGAAVLLHWAIEDDPVYSEFVLPDDAAYLAYRAAIREAGAAVRAPEPRLPDPTSDEEARLYRDERHNAALARSGEAGRIEPIRCLDALLFARQNGRVPEFAEPTEFLASVLRLELEGPDSLVVLFGAGEEMFPPKSVYGFDVVEEYVRRGWRWTYALHNHTIQRENGGLVLGTPALSTSDVQLTRNLAVELGLEAARVTNGLWTYHVAADQLAQLRSR